MAIIYSYPTVNPTVSDLVLGTDVSTTNRATKNFTVQSLIDLVTVTGNTLQIVLDNNNVASGRNIVLGSTAAPTDAVYANSFITTATSSFEGTVGIGFTSITTTDGAGGVGVLGGILNIASAAQINITSLGILTELKVGDANNIITKIVGDTVALNGPMTSPGLNTNLVTEKAIAAYIETKPFKETLAETLATGKDTGGTDINVTAQGGVGDNITMSNLSSIQIASQDNTGTGGGNISVSGNNFIIKNPRTTAGSDITVQGNDLRLKSNADNNISNAKDYLVGISDTGDPSSFSTSLYHPDTTNDRVLTTSTTGISIIGNLQMTGTGLINAKAGVVFGGTAGGAGAEGIGYLMDSYGSKGTANQVLFADPTGGDGVVWGNRTGIGYKWVMKALDSSDPPVLVSVDIDKDDDVTFNQGYQTKLSFNTGTRTLDIATAADVPSFATNDPGVAYWKIVSGKTQLYGEQDFKYTDTNGEQRLVLRDDSANGGGVIATPMFTTDTAYTWPVATGSPQWRAGIMTNMTSITSIGVAPAGSPLLIAPGFVGNASASLLPIPNDASTAQNVQFQGNASTANQLSIPGQVSMTGDTVASTVTYTNGGAVPLVSTIAASVVYNKELAGFNATSGSVVGNDDSIIEALEKLQGQITNLPQGIVYQGIWNPGTSATSGGTPDLRLADNKVNGHYYIVSTIGIGTPNGDGTTPNDWDVRDWCVFADDGAGGGADEWQKIDNSSLAGGTGTPNTITKWLTNQTIGNSSIQDTGSSGTGVVLADTVNFTTKGINTFGNSISDTSSFTGAVTFAENINLTKGLGVWDGTSAFVYGPISGTTKRVLTSGGAIGAPPTWEVPTVGSVESVALTHYGDAFTVAVTDANGPDVSIAITKKVGALATDYINGLGNITAFPTLDNYVDWKLQGDSGTNQSIIKQTIVDFAGGTKISTAVATNATQKTLTINHVTQGNTNATATAAPAFGGTFTAISAVPVDTTGHLTGQTVKTITLPSPVNFGSGSAPGATAAVGTAGYVPAPAAGTGSTAYFLNGLGGFTVPPNDDGVTAVTATAPIASTGGDTPVISHNNVLTDAGGTAGTYDSVTVDAKGHVTNGTNPGGSGGGIFSGDQAIPAAANATLAFTLTRAATGTLIFDVFLTSETSNATSQAMKFTVAHSYNTANPVFNKVIDTGLDGTTGFTVEFKNSNTGATGTSVICEITSAGGVAQNIGYTVQVGHDSTNALTFTPAST